jgi:hypothetical protein
MAWVIGVVLALCVGLMATAIRLDRDRALYPAVMMVIAAYYVLFALMGASGNTLVLELLVAGLFLALAVWGFKSSLWLVAFALAAHGIFDVIHSHVIDNPGVPAWWPPFCITYDVTAAAYLAGLLLTRRVRAAAVSGQ